MGVSIENLIEEKPIVRWYKYSNEGSTDDFWDY